MTYRPLPVRQRLRACARARRASALILTAIAALLVAVPALADPRIESKRAEARRVLAQIQELDAQLGKAIEAYNGATVKLEQIHADMRVNRFDLEVARRNHARAQARLAARLRDLYIADETQGTLEIVLGATSLEDLINRIDTVSRVSEQDAEVLRQVKHFKRTMERRAVELRKAEAAQAEIVAERAAIKRRIEAGLAERQRMLSSIRTEIARLREEERRRQELLARQARARLAAQRAVQQAAIDDAVVGVTAETPEGATVLPPAKYGGVVGEAMQYLGVPYVWGGASPSGFDCSGFVMYVFAKFGVSLPHHAASIWNYGVPVPKDQLQPGDLVFFNGLGHMGIYIGGGQMIHAPHTGDVVKISDINSGWYLATYVGAKRIL